MKNAIIVSFNNQSITAFMHNDTPVVAMKPIVENIGLDWASQFSRIKRHPVMSKGIVMITTPSAGGEQQTFCLPLKMLNGWLFGIDSNRVKPEIKDSVIAYQEKCFDVLAEHFGLNTPKRNVITPEQAAFIQKTVNRLVRSTGEHYQTIYHRIKDVFHVDKYDNLKQEQFPALCEYLGVVYEGEHIPRSDAPAVPAGKVLVSLNLLEGLLEMHKLQRERFHLIEQAEKDVKHALDLLTVIANGQMRQASDSVKEARYKLIDSITHASYFANMIKREVGM